MKKQSIFTVLVALALFAGSNAAFADSIRDTVKPLFFNAEGTDISFDAESQESPSQSTCAMTPTGAAQAPVLPPPPVAVPENEIFQPAAYATPFARPTSLNNVPPPGNPNRPYYPMPPVPPVNPPDNPSPPPPPPEVPEPATMLVLGLGLAGALLARRRKS